MDIYEEAHKSVLADLQNESGMPSSVEELDENAKMKIASHAARYGHSVEEVTEAILQNEVTYRAIVGKNPSRMDYFEETLAQFLRGLAFVKSVKKLPKGGANAVHVSNGAIQIGGGKRKFIKSLDLEVEFKNLKKVYVIHKYTKQGGGAQDSALRDALLTLEQGVNEKTNSRVNLVACLDGAFYQMKLRSGKSRLEQAKLDFPEALICTYETFEDVTKTIWKA